MAETQGHYHPEKICGEQTYSCAEIIALRDAGELDVCQHYLVDVPQHGNLPATQALIHATSPTTLSMEAKIIHPFSAQSWHGLLDIDNCRYNHIEDEFSNEITGATTSIPQFPWGTPNVLQNSIEDATLVDWNLLTGSEQVRDNRIVGGTYTLRAGLTQVLRNEFNQATVDLSGGSGTYSFTDNEINFATYRDLAGSTGNRFVNDNEMRDGFIVEIAATNTQPVTLDDNVFKSHTTGTTPDLLINLTGGSVNFSDSTIIATASGTAPNVLIEGAGGAVSILDDTKIRNGRLVRNAASTGSVTFRGSTINDFLFEIGANQTNTLTVEESEFMSDGTIIANGGALVSIIGSRFIGGVQINLTQAAGVFELSFSDIYGGAGSSINIGGASGSVFITESKIKRTTINRNAAATANLSIISSEVTSGTITQTAGAIGQELLIVGTIFNVGDILQESTGTLNLDSGNIVNLSNFRVHPGSTRGLHITRCVGTNMDIQQFATGDADTDRVSFSTFGWSTINFLGVKTGLQLHTAVDMSGNAILNVTDNATSSRIKMDTNGIVNLNNNSNLERTTVSNDYELTLNGASLVNCVCMGDFSKTVSVTQSNKMHTVAFDNFI